MHDHMTRLTDFVYSVIWSVLAWSNMDKLDHLLEAAANRFAHYGFRRTSVDDIARDAGIAKGSIYLHVSGKDDLFFKTVERERELWTDSNEAAIAGVENPAEALQLLVLDSIRWLDERPLIGRLMMGDPELGLTQELLLACMHGPCDDAEQGCLPSVGRKIRLISGLIEAGIKTGRFRKDLSVQTTLSLVVSLFHIHLHNRRMKFIEMNTQDYIREAMKVLLEGIEERGGKTRREEGENA
jgi:AcrR family transcriptional regulator